MGRPVQSRSELQLHRVTVQVESVLRGTIPDRSILLYYFTLANLNVDWRFPIFHEAPVRRVLWLRKDHGVYRAACDVQNCTVRIESGAHPGYHPTSAASLEQTLVDLSLTRGVGAVNNYRFVQEMGSYIGHLGLDAFTIDKLKNLALTETGEVKDTACHGLWSYDRAASSDEMRRKAHDSAISAGCRLQTGRRGVSIGPKAQPAPIALLTNPTRSATLPASTNSSSNPKSR